MSVVLIGVVHRDPRGHELLSGLLKHLRPNAICLEFSPAGLLWRSENATRLMNRLCEALRFAEDGGLNHSQVQLIKTALELPFEYRASLTYANNKGIPLHLVDVNWISQQHLPRFEAEIITKENLARLIDGPNPPQELLIEAEYAKARTWLEHPSLSNGFLADPLQVRREAIMACRIRKIASYHGNIVHIGGWRHIIMDPYGRTLASLLEDLHPERILLRDNHHKNITETHQSAPSFGWRASLKSIEKGVFENSS